MQIKTSTVIDKIMPPPGQGEARRGLSFSGKWLLVVILLLALVGLADATYLTVEHFRGEIPACSLTDGCETVTTSAYSEVAGMPVALFGALFYLGVLFLGFFILVEGKWWLLRWLARYSWIGLLAAIYFTGVQAFILQAYCQYCLLSAASSTLIFLCAYALAGRSTPQSEVLSPQLDCGSSMPNLDSRSRRE